MESISSILQVEYTRRKSKNPRLSLRAFSRQLGISKTALAETMNGKRALSPRNILRVSNSLALSPGQVKSVISNRWVTNSYPESEYESMDDAAFEMISEWYFLAILNLARLPSNRNSPEWISSRLGISTLEARIAVIKLQEYGLIKVKGRRLIRTSKPILTQKDTPSGARRKYHRQMIEKASAAQDEVPVELREITSITMPSCSNKMKQAKKRIQKFKEDMSEFLGTGNVDQVFTLNIQLFPISKKPRKTK